MGLIRPVLAPERFRLTSEINIHPNEQLLTKLFQSLNAHDHNGIADCYHKEATFQDIAFTLSGKEQIHAMWDTICSNNEVGIRSDIVAAVRELSADESTGRVIVVEDYTFRDTGRGVHNTITSTFEFRDGLIFKQKDNCDPVRWASQAFGGLRGLIAGHVEFARRRAAMKKLAKQRPQAFHNA